MKRECAPSRLQAERARGECALAQQAGALAAARRARAQLQAQHERERTALRERARTLQRRLAALDSEYSAQLDSLRAAYQVGRASAPRSGDRPCAALMTDVACAECGGGGHARRRVACALPAGDRAAARALREGLGRHGKHAQAHSARDGGETPRGKGAAEVPVYIIARGIPYTFPTL